MLFLREEYNTRDSNYLRTGRQRTVMYQHLPSEIAVAVFINRQPNTIKISPMPEAIKDYYQKAYWFIKHFIAQASFL